MKYSSLLITCFCLILVGCGGQTEQANLSEIELSTFVDEELGVSFDYPSDWVIDNSPINTENGFQFATHFVRAFIFDPNSGEDFAANLNFVVQQTQFLAPSGAERAKQEIQTLKTLGESMGISDYKDLELSPYEIGGYKAAILIGEYKISQIDLPVVVMQLFVPVGQNSYELTLTVKKEQIEKYRPIFQKIAESFQFNT